MADIAFIALGSNLGDRAAHLAAARAALSFVAGVRMIAASSVEETAPLGPVSQGPYLNQMVAIDTVLSPGDLLATLHRIERSAGRVRSVRWGPRSIDLDIVRFGSHQSEDVALTLPHPGLHDRDFWQREVAELGLLMGAAQ